jgi:hypothetical protein
MAVRGEEVASSIDAQVRESVERLVSEIRSSIEDVRQAVDSQLKAALQSVQADVNAITFLPQIQKAVGDLEESIAGDQPPAPAAPSAPTANAGPVKRGIQQLERGKSQVDVLNALLDECLGFGSRAALLILRGETFSGWKGVGFSAAGGNDEMVKRFNAAPGLIPELDRVLRHEQVVHWDGANLATRLGVPASSQAVLVPMVIKDKVAAAVYVDAVDADVAKMDASSIEILVFTTGLLIDTLAMRKKVPSPSLNDSGEASDSSPSAPPAAAPQVPPPPAAAAPEPPARPAPSAPASQPPATSLGAGPSPESTVSFSASQIREMMGTSSPGFNVPSADEFSTPAPRPSVPAAPPAPPPAPPAAPATAPPPVAAGALGSAAGDEKPTTQYIPPAGINRGTSPGASNDEAKKHDEARRFARLLVSEIKLYNEAKVEQGRRNKDLYERLKEDIDRSRQMYDERIAEEVRKTSNYFYDELVRILADGQSEALGL